MWEQPTNRCRTYWKDRNWTYWKKLKINFCAGNPPADAELTEKTETEFSGKKLKLNFCAGNPSADAELTEKAETELTEKNLNWTFVQAIHQQMLNIQKRL